MKIPERLISALKTGKVVLFLGAGANYNCNMANGEIMPTGEKLSEMLSEKFDVPERTTLSETAELVEAKYTRSQLNSYICELLVNANPSEGFKLIKTFKWDSIYTTNYDMLIEDIYNSKDVEARQDLKVFYTSNQHMDLGTNTVPLYKLHGCILRADTTEGRLLITPDDYADYYVNRSRLFNRLADSLSDKPFLYLGYGRQDPNFRTILAHVHKEMNGDVPEGYALFPNKSEEDDLVWDKKGVNLLDIDVDIFLKTIDRETPQRYSITAPNFNFPLFEQYEKIHTPDLQESLSYFSVPIPEYGQKINPVNFYKGSEANWIDIENAVDAARDMYDDVMENLLEDAISIENQTTSYCILAEAGAGKSTFLRRMAYDLCHDYQQLVFWYKGQRRLNYEIIEDIFKSTGKRIFIFVDRASKYIGNLEHLRRDCTATRIPVTFVLTDRANEWHFGDGNSFKITEEWALIKLSNDEIDNIIERLELFDCLGNLKDLTKDQRRKRFREYSDRQLLIALREATEGKKFDELVIDEYENIPNSLARKSYLHICCFNSFGRGIRISSLSRSLGVSLIDLAEILGYLEGLVNFNDEIYSARHTIISKIVYFSLGEATRIDVLESLIKRLDLGYTSDHQIFRDLMKNQELIKSLGNIESRRRLFEALKVINPSEPYIEHHEARMEIRSHNEGGSLDRAEGLLKNALRRTDDAVAIRHTAGLLYKQRGLNTKGIEKRTNLTRAVNEFQELTKRAPSDNYAWVSLVETRLLLGSINSDKTEKFPEYARAEADYQKALENLGSTPHLFKAKGKIEAALGHGDDARDFFKKAIEGAAPPKELLVNYIKWELRHKGIQEASIVSKKALNLYGADPEIMVLRGKSWLLGEDWELSDFISLFIDAQRSSTGYIKMEAHFWHAVALWEAKRYDDAMKQFSVSKDISISLDRRDFKQIRYISGMNTGSPDRYTGTLINKGPRSVWLHCNPSGVQVYINPIKFKQANGDTLNIKIGFNRLGPVAISDIERESYSFDNLV